MIDQDQLHTERETLDEHSALLATAVYTGQEGQIDPGMLPGGTGTSPGTPAPMTPGIPALYAQTNNPPGIAPAPSNNYTGVGGIDGLGQQNNNAYVQFNWASNPAADNVVTYEFRYRVTGGTKWQYVRSPGTTSGGVTLTYKLTGLAQNTSYDFNIQALNNAGVPSGFNASDYVATTFVDATAPATPTGLSAIRTPRGALVTWSANTEADLQGYQLQISLDSGSTWSNVNAGVGGQLATSVAYVAPTGTPLGQLLQFRVRAVDWSNNASAWLVWPSSTQYHDAVLADAPQHWWRLNDAGPTTAADSGTPGGNNGTKTGTLTWSQSGPTQDSSAAAVQFDGSTGYLTDGNVYNAMAAFSVEAWIKSNGQQATVQEIVRKGGNVWALRVGDTPGAVKMLVWDNSATLYASPASTTHVDDGAWHHVVGTWDGTTIRLYVDGLLQGTNNIGAHTLQTDSNNLAIGATYSGAEFWNGWLSEVALYNSALSPARIQAHYVAGGAQTDGVIMDELRAGNVKVYGTLTTGGFQTAEAGQRFMINSSAIQGFDSTSNNYGLTGGAGNTVYIGSNGSAQLAGNVYASGISGSKIVVASNATPTYAGSAPADPATGLAMDPVNGFRVLKGSSLAMQADMNGNITINSGVGGGALTVNGGTVSGAVVVGSTIYAPNASVGPSQKGIIIDGATGKINLWSSGTGAGGALEWWDSGSTNQGGIFLDSSGNMVITAHHLNLYLHAAVERTVLGSEDDPGSTNTGSKTYIHNSNTLASSSGSQQYLGAFSGITTNLSQLVASLYRTATGSDWTTASILLGYDVDSTGGSGGYITWSHGGQGVQTSSPAYVWDVNGNCHAAGFPTSSDKRLKRDIKPLGPTSALMASVDAVRFGWDPTALAAAGRDSYIDPYHPEDQGEHFGFLAQDVIKQFPEVVTFWTGRDGVKYHAVDYTRLIPVLWEAVKELQAQVLKLPA